MGRRPAAARGRHRAAPPREPGALPVRCGWLRAANCARGGQRGVLRVVFAIIISISRGLKEAEASSRLRAFRFVYFYPFPCYLLCCSGGKLARSAMT